MILTRNTDRLIVATAINSRVKRGLLFEQTDATSIYFGAAIARESLSLSDSGITVQLGDCCARCHLKSFTSPQALVTASSSKRAACGFVHGGERDKTQSNRKQHVLLYGEQRFQVCVCFKPGKSTPASGQVRVCARWGISLTLTQPFRSRSKVDTKGDGPVSYFYVRTVCNAKKQNQRCSKIHQYKKTSICMRCMAMFPCHHLQNLGLRTHGPAHFPKTIWQQ